MSNIFKVGQNYYLDAITYDSNNDGIINVADNIAGNPTVNQYYGTNASAVKGFYDFSITSNGHIIQLNGTNLSQQSTLNFIGNVNVINDSINNVTIVEVLGTNSTSDFKSLEAKKALWLFYD